MPRPGCMLLAWDTGPQALLQSDPLSPQGKGGGAGRGRSLSSLNTRQPWTDVAGGRPRGSRTRAHLGFLLMDVNVTSIRTCAHCTGHHVVQLEESTGQCAEGALPSHPCKLHPPCSYLLQDEIQAHALLPVDVGVPQAWQLLGVAPVHLHLHLGLSLCLLQHRAGVNVLATEHLCPTMALSRPKMDRLPTPTVPLPVLELWDPQGIHSPLGVWISSSAPGQHLPLKVIVMIKKDHIC